ncbi:MAG: hypothetical protein ABI972_12360 [Acidobacteriota bacterium]
MRMWKQAFKWIERLDASSSLWVKLGLPAAGGAGLSSLWQAVLSALSLPIMLWWSHLLVAAGCAAVMALIVRRVIRVSESAERASVANPASVQVPSKLKINSATWGNDVSRESRLEDVLTKQREGLVFYVNNDELGGIPNDPAPTDDNKYVSIDYTFLGKPPRTIKRKQGEWVVIPEEGLLMPAKPKRLRLVGIHAGEEPVGQEPLEVSIKSESGMVTSNVTVRIKFTSDSGDAFTVPAAHWEVRKWSGTTKYSSVFPGPLSVDIDARETQSFLLMTKDEAGQWWAFGESAVKGLVNPGRWEAHIQVCMDDARDHYATIGFVVHRDNSIQWDQPAIKEVDIR